MSLMGMNSLYKPEWNDDNCMFHHEDEFADFYSLGTSSIQSKKVYVVIQCGYETLHSTEIIGAFTSEELAKKYGENSSSKFINGALATAVKELNIT